MSGSVKVIVSTKSHRTEMTIIFSLCVQSVNFYRGLTYDHYLLKRNDERPVENFRFLDKNSKIWHHFYFTIRFQLQITLQKQQKT